MSNVNIIKKIEDFIDKRVISAHSRIIDIAVKRVENISNIMIFGYNPLINNIIICSSKNKNIKLSICVGEHSKHSKHSKHSSLKLLKTFLHNLDISNISNISNISISYFHINALSYVLPTVDTILLGCNGVMANGDIIGPIGTSLVSLVARNKDIPVIVCCETLSFTKKIQTGVDFEVKPSDKKGVSYKRYVSEYDITPAKFISQIITENGIIHPLSSHNFIE